MLASAAYAGQAEDVAFKAASCWDLPAGTGEFSKATFEVTFDERGGILDATVLDNRNGTSGEKIFVLSALRALQKCRPYETRGTVRITMDTAQIPRAQGSIDPFK